MELTLDQALQKGVEAHKAGNAQEADRYYTAILKANPKHPDANHNMGVLAAGVGKVEAALPFFKTALETNPNVAQYWLSYIDALIKLNRITDAKAVFDQAKSHGAKGDGFDQIEVRLNIPTVKAKNETREDPPTQPNILDELKLDKALKLANRKVKDGLIEEAKKIYQDILKKFPKNKKALVGIKTAASRTLDYKPDLEEPPSDQLQGLVSLYTQGQHEEVLNQSSHLLKQFPNSVNLYNIIGAAKNSLSKLPEAIEAYEKAISIKPAYAKAHNNMGSALQKQGKLDEAIKAYTKALSVKPDYAKAYYNMGVTLKEQGKLDEAIEAYKKALIIKPENAEAYDNMGNALKEQGKLGEAIEAYEKALSIKPDYGSATHMLSALTGNTVKTAPREYVENLFDEYSKKFELSLVENLEYKIPKLIRDILIKQNSKESLGSVFDLGCGSGLLGQEIRNYCSRLEGIDLSRKMLELAKQKNVYDNLNHSDIEEYLSRGALDFDYYISLDVFIYVGELFEIFRLIKSRNKKPGKLVFSTEHTDLDGFHILKSGRYAHSKSYIENLCKEFGYKISHFSTTNLRKEKEHFLTGGIYILEFGKEI